MTVLQAIAGFFTFFNEIMQLIKILQGTPEEKHQEIMKKIEAEAQKFKDTGRPSWD